MQPGPASSRRLGPLLAVFFAVAGLQLWLVAAAGTDIPLLDQWDIEGRWLYPRWLDGRFTVLDLLHSGNEHRLAWTHLLNLGLFALNGQWDPLVQQCVNAGLRAGMVTLLAWTLARGSAPARQWAIAGGIAFAFLPHLAWHTALWGIESHAYFVLGFSLATLALLQPAQRSRGRTMAGLLAGVAALLAMAPAALVPCALLALAAFRAWGRRQWDRALWTELWPALLLLLLALSLRVDVGPSASHVSSVPVFLAAAGRMLAWPHGAMPWAALVMNVPLAWAVARRCQRDSTATATDDFALSAGLWAVGIGLAAAWVRGGTGELGAGVPSRYVDFIVLLPIANAWFVAGFVRQAAPRFRWLVVAWAVFLFIGWLGLSAEVMRGLVLPRARDREAPVRLARSFQLTGETAPLANQPRLLVPHSDLTVVRAVLDDPRLQGRLPPSLQPERSMGPLSRGVRWLLRRPPPTP